MDQLKFKSLEDQVERLKNPTDYNMSGHPYHDYIEYVDTNFADKFKEYDREDDYRNPNHHYLDDLTTHIKQYGIEEPIIMGFNPKTGYTRIIEGNHRLAVAKRLGLDKVPVRMLRRETIEVDPTGKHGGSTIDINKVPARETFIKSHPDWQEMWDYIPYYEDMKPSDWFYDKQYIKPYTRNKSANVDDYVDYVSNNENAWHQWRFNR